MELASLLLVVDCRFLSSDFLNGFVKLLPEGGDGLGLLLGPLADLNAELGLF